MKRRILPGLVLLAAFSLISLFIISGAPIAAGEPAGAEAAEASEAAADAKAAAGAEAALDAMASDSDSDYYAAIRELGRLGDMERVKAAIAKGLASSDARVRVGCAVCAK